MRSKVSVAFGLLEWFLDFLDHHRYDDIHPRARARQMDGYFFGGNNAQDPSLSGNPLLLVVSEVYSDCMIVHTCTCCMFWFIWLLLLGF